MDTRITIDEPAAPARTTGRAPGAGQSAAVDHPLHYNAHPSGVECIEVIEHMPANVAMAVKYCWRAGLKESSKEIEDMEKAVWYLQREVQRLKKRPAGAAVQAPKASWTANLDRELKKLRAEKKLQQAREGK